MEFLLLGQATTGRVETLESYLRTRCQVLAKIGVPGVRQRSGGNVAVYERGRLLRTSSAPSFPLASNNSIFVISLYYFIQSLLILLNTLAMRRRFQIAIGISAFYAMMAIALKNLGIVKHVIYYSIDYYNSNSSFRMADRYCSRASDIVWNLSNEISKNRGNSNGILVPMTYDSALLRLALPFNEIDRFSLCFIGTLEELQGLQVVIEAMATILKRLPETKIKIVGDGPFAKQLMELAKRKQVSDHVINYGFIKEDTQAMEILRRCAVGLAPYILVPENNVLRTEPGKPKLYTFLGLPVIMTKFPSGTEIEQAGAAISVDCTPEAIAAAVLKLLHNPCTLNEYRNRAKRFAESCSSDIVFTNAFDKTLQMIHG